MTGYELMVSNLDLQSRAERVGRLPADELRRLAVTACRDRDIGTLWSICEAYLVLRGARGARVSANTLATYRFGLDAFMNWSGDAAVNLLHPRPNDAHTYARHLEAQRLAPSSVRVRLAAARCLYAGLRWSGATDAAPFTDVKAPADPVSRSEKRKPYPQEDLQLLLAQADPQEAVVVLLGAHAGLRVSEMVGLQRSDLFLDAREPYLTVTGKRQKRQDVPVSPSLAAALKRWMTMTPQLAPRILGWKSRSSLNNHVETLCIRAGVRYDRRHVHGLRHSAGTRVYQETTDLLAVRDHLRHSDITSSEIYVEYARKGRPSVTKDW